MHHPTNTSPSESIRQQAPAEQETILSGLADPRAYEKHVKNARIWLYVIAGFQVVLGFVEYFTLDENILAAAALGIDALIGVFFFALAQWSRKKPVPAFLTALIAYIVLVVGLMILDPSNISVGIIIKIVVVIALFKAYRSAKEYEELKASLGEASQ